MAAPTITERNGSRPKGPGRAPVIDGPAPLSVRTAGRNRIRILLGAALIVGSAFGAAVLFSGADHRVAVLTVAHRVPAGQAVAASDLREVLVTAPGGTTVGAAALDSVIGRVAAVDLVPGSLLARGQLASRGEADVATASVGVLLAEGRFPSGLAAGDRVLVIEVSAANGGADDGGDGQQFSATVEAVGHGTTDGSADVTLAVAPDDAPQVAALAARGRLALVVMPS